MFKGHKEVYYDSKQTGGKSPAEFSSLLMMPLENIRLETTCGIGMSADNEDDLLPSPCLLPSPRCECDSNCSRELDRHRAAMLRDSLLLAALAALEP